MNGTIPPGLPTPSPPPPPSSAITWAQSFLLASLGIGLYTSVGAVMGKQWLNHYDRVGVRGTLKERGMERQRKLDALIRWHFHSVLESLPFLLEASLFLFAAGLSTFLWAQQRATGALYIVINVIGVMLYVSITVTAARYPDCPFQTPLSLRLRRLSLSLQSSWRNVISPSIKRETNQAWQRYTTMCGKVLAILKRWSSKISRPVDTYLVNPPLAAWSTVSGFFARASNIMTPPHPAEGRSMPVADDSTQTHGDLENQPTNPVPPQTQPISPAFRLLWRVWGKLNSWLKSVFGQARDPTHLGGGQHIQTASGPSESFLVSLRVPNHAAPSPPVPPTDAADAASVAWILDTCTDPSVEAVTLEYMLDIDWPENFDFRPLLNRFFNGFIDCFERDQRGNIIPTLASSSQKPSSNIEYGCIFLFLYWHGRTVSPESVKNWDCWLDRRHHHGMIGSVVRDELTYIYSWANVTVDCHSNIQHPISGAFGLWKAPGPKVWENLSQTTAVALSRFWHHVFPSADEDKRWICFKHIIDLGAHVPMTPTVLARYHGVFSQVVGDIWQRGVLEERYVAGVAIATSHPS